MFFKIPRAYWKLLGVLFTTIVAPLSVRQLDEASRESLATDPIPAAVSSMATQTIVNATTRVVAHGNGPTPEAAFQNAVDAALQSAIATEVGAADWNRYGQVYLSQFRHDGNGIMRGWCEVSNVSERHLTGKTYRSEVAVDIDGRILRERLHLIRRVTPP